MAVRVRADAIERVTATPDRFALQVLAADDLAAALGAARLFRVDLVGLSGGDRHADVSPVVAAPDGPLLLVQRLHATDEDLRRIPRLLARRLEDAGVSEATVRVAALGGGLDVLDATPGCVVLRLFPMPDGRATTIPPDWLDVAVDWVAGDLGDDEPVTARILSVEHEVAAREASGVLHECGTARAWCDIVNGDPADRIRTASVTYGRLPHLALAAGGPALDTAGLVARFALLQDVGRELAADVAYASCDFEPTFESLSLGLPVDGWRARGGASPDGVAAAACDVAVPDAYPWQVLGPGHLQRFEELGEAPPPFEHLGDGRVEVALGDPSAWLPRSRDRMQAQEDAFTWLGPLLVDDDELAALDATRDRRANRRGGRAASPLTPVRALTVVQDDAVPDLAAIVLRTTPSARRSTRLSPLELAAWFAHEPHSDHPAAVSPVLATFVRWWAAGLGEEGCQRLKPLVPRLVGTAGDEDGDHVRRWLSLDWLVRDQAPRWLRLAGLVEAADRLAALGELRDEQELTRAIEVLGGAITVAGRRIDITVSIVGGDERDDPDDVVAWDAWEGVTEATAWVAASEAATERIPGDVAYATDLRVIECSRDASAHDSLEEAGTPVGTTAWTTAVHALADEAWERAWRAADAAARDASGLTIRVEMGRVAKTTLHRGDAIAVGQENPEVALELAEAAALKALVHAALRGGSPDLDGEHPWDAARNAARASSGGAVWSVVSDESREAVGEAAWAQAMDDARVVVDEVLADGPDTLARAVAAAVAREACSAAARGVAYRAAAVARAHGADDDAAAKAAREALEPTAHELREAGFELLESLTAARSTA